MQRIGICCRPEVVLPPVRVRYLWNVYAKTEAEKKRDAYKKKLKAKTADIANIKDSEVGDVKRQQSANCASPE